MAAWAVDNQERDGFDEMVAQEQAIVASMLSGVLSVDELAFPSPEAPVQIALETTIPLPNPRNAREGSLPAYGTAY